MTGVLSPDEEVSSLTAQNQATPNASRRNSKHHHQLNISDLESHANTFSPSEQISIYAMLSSSPTQQALGFSECRKAFPQAEEYRQKAKETKSITDSLDRFRHIFPKERYGRKRTLPTFENKETFFRDLDVTKEVEDREGQELSVHSNSTGSRRHSPIPTPDRLSPINTINNNRSLNCSPVSAARRSSLVQLQSESFRNSPTNSLSQFNPIVDDAYDSDASHRRHRYEETIESAGVVTRIDLFSERLSTTRLSEEGHVGVQAYLNACKRYNTKPVVYFLDCLTRTHIDLGGYGVSSEGAMAMAEVLKSNVYIIKLNLGGNKIGDESGGAIFENIRSNTTLTEVILQHNDLGSCTGAEMAKTLAANSKLDLIDISHNKITDICVESLAEVLTNDNRRLVRSVRTRANFLIY